MIDSLLFLLHKHLWNPRIFPFAKRSYLHRALFLSFTCEDIGIAIVTKMITIAMVIESLKKYLGVLLSDRSIICPSSEIFGIRPKNVPKSSSFLWNKFGKFSEIFGKSSKTSSLVCLYNKQNITCPLVDMSFIFSCSTWHFHEWQRTRGHVLSSICTASWTVKYRFSVKLS